MRDSLPWKTHCCIPPGLAKIVAGGREIGVLGEVAPGVEALDVRGRPYVYELDFDALMECAPRIMSHRELPRYPALNRHIAVVVKDKVNSMT